MKKKISKQHEDKQKVLHTMKVNNKKKPIEVKHYLKISVDDDCVIKYLQLKKLLKKLTQKEHTELS